MSDSLRLNIRVKTYDTYPNGKLSIPSLLNFLQEAAGLHAIKLKFGMDDLNARNETWVLSRMRVEIDRWPEKGDDIVVETCCLPFGTFWCMTKMEKLLQGPLLIG